MKWSNVAAWLLSIASLAFAADPKLAKGLDGAHPRKTVDRTVQFKHVPEGPGSLIDRVANPDNAAPGNQVVAATAPGACVPDNFMLSKISFSHYQNTTSTSSSPQYDQRGSTSVSGTNTLWANALWGSSTIAGLNLLVQGGK